MGSLRICFIVSCFVTVSLCIFTGCSKKTEAPPPSARIVHVAESISKDIPVYVDTFGSLAAYTTVDLKSQVTGKIETNHFLEGSFVTNGQVLFTIEKDDYKSALDFAQAQLNKSKAELKNANDNYKRKKKLLEQAVISQDEFEEAETTLNSRLADVHVAEANVEVAQLNLKRCDVHSPLNGVTGMQLVDAGNIVPANSGPTLVTIKRIDPLLLDFTVPEKYVKELREAIPTGKVTVDVTIEGHDTVFTGTVDFVENEVSTQTGTLFLRAVIPNPDAVLWPGQFVRARVTYATRKNAVLVPRDAVRMGKDGEYVFVISPEKKAELRGVATGLQQGRYIEVFSNVAPKETVVTVGQISLTQGTPVSIASDEE